MINHGPTEDGPVRMRGYRVVVEYHTVKTWRTEVEVVASSPQAAADEVLGNPAGLNYRDAEEVSDLHTNDRVLVVEELP